RHRADGSGGGIESTSARFGIGGGGMGKRAGQDPGNKLCRFKNQRRRSGSRPHRSSFLRCRATGPLQGAARDLFFGSPAQNAERKDTTGSCEEAPSSIGAISLDHPISLSPLLEGLDVGRDLIDETLPRFPAGPCDVRGDEHF